MLSVVVALAIAPLLVHTAPNPTEPSSTSVFREGGKCLIRWDPDTTGDWDVMNIELMTGSNLGMVHLRTVATVDATNADNASFEYDCLSVEPNSAIYFYQFTSPASTDVLWTTRFTIADAQGNTTPPTDEETNAAGDIIPWGTGNLENPSLVDTPPAYGTNVGGGGNSTSSTAGPSTQNTATSTRSSSTRTPSGSPSPSASSTASEGSASTEHPGMLLGGLLAVFTSLCGAILM